MWANQWICKTVNMMANCLTTEFHTNFGIVNRLFDANFILWNLLKASRTLRSSCHRIFDYKITNICCGRQCCQAFFSSVFLFFWKNSTNATFEIKWVILIQCNSFTDNYENNKTHWALPIFFLMSFWSSIRNFAYPLIACSDAGRCFMKKQSLWNQFGYRPSWAVD